MADPPPLAMKRKRYSSPATAAELHLGGQVAAGVDLLVHGERCVLRVAQVAAGVGVEDPAGESLLVAVAAEDPLALFADHDGRAGVLAHREDHLGRDHRVLHELERDVAVVGGALRVLEDLRQQLQVRGTVEVRHVGERLPRQQRQRLGRHLQDVGPFEPDRGHVAFGQPTVLGPVPREREHLLEFELVHARTSRQHRQPVKGFIVTNAGRGCQGNFPIKKRACILPDAGVCVGSLRPFSALFPRQDASENETVAGRSRPDGRRPLPPFSYYRSLP